MASVKEPSLEKNVNLASVKRTNSRNNQVLHIFQFLNKKKKKRKYSSKHHTRKLNLKILKEDWCADNEILTFSKHSVYFAEQQLLARKTIRWELKRLRESEWYRNRLSREYSELGVEELKTEIWIEHNFFINIACLKEILNCMLKTVSSLLLKYSR